MHANKCLLLLLVAACGSDAAVTVDAPPMANEDNVAAYLELVYQIDSAGAAYASVLADPALTQESCRAANAQYDRVSRAAVGQMLGRAEDLDHFMDAHDGGFQSDVLCTAQAMMNALDNHHNTACMWPDIERDRSEANAHLQIMMGHVDHAELRCQEMLAGMGGSDWTWSPPVGCTN